MDYTFNIEARKKEMTAILNSSHETIQKNLELIKEDYKRVFKKDLCASCPTGVREAIFKLKYYYNMSQFRLSSPKGHYKIKKGARSTIHNGNLTDELAIEFLKISHERIKLFSEYPSNWKELVEGNKETDEERLKRLAIEAEVAQAAYEAEMKAQGTVGPPPKEDGEDSSKEDDDSKEESGQYSEEEIQGLLDLHMDELREKFPDVKARSKVELLNEALGLDLK